MKKVVFMLLMLLVIFAVGHTDNLPNGQIITNVKEILKANPLSAGEEIQMIKIAQDDTVTSFVVRITKGAEIKPHFHKTHSETVSVVKGKGQLLIDGKWVEIKPGVLHFNPMTKVHALKNTGRDELIVLTIFTPAMKETDRQFISVQ